MSQAAVLQYWLRAPARAPAAFRQRLERVRQDGARLRPEASTQPWELLEQTGQLFNADSFGLPQNEESVAACRTNPQIVLGGTNDYRGLLDPEQNFTGWSLSTNGGFSLAQEGRLPPILHGGTRFASGGNPAVAMDAACNLYAGTLSVPLLNEPSASFNAVSVYLSDANTLASCFGETDSACWPIRRVVAAAAPLHVVDKPWLSAGPNGDVWITYTDFDGLTGKSSIQAVRCHSQLEFCSEPIRVSGNESNVQFSDVTMGPDGRVYVTWSEVSRFTGPPLLVHKLRIAPAGSLEFGPIRVIAVEGDPIAGGSSSRGPLQANDFQAATYLKHEVALVNGRPRIFAVWDACSELVQLMICENPEILLTWSDNDGATWSQPTILSHGGVNYFPTLSYDSAGRLVVAWFTHRYDQMFDHRQDVELVDIVAEKPWLMGRRRLTGVSNEPASDPFLGGLSIGESIEVFAHQSRAYLHYNANYRKVRFLGQGVPVNQQDNFLFNIDLIESAEPTSRHLGPEKTEAP
ncbi:MAG: hypothetical protein JXB05_17215 [Myxococcaceae bacterium]|nr:hypothetical protein [Myxococcaceae bacterium]